MKKCENDVKCYRATWITGQCFLHNASFEVGSDINSTGYICKGMALRIVFPFAVHNFVNAKKSIFTFLYDLK